MSQSRLPKVSIPAIAVLAATGALAQTGNHAGRPMPPVSPTAGQGASNMAEMPGVAHSGMAMGLAASSPADGSSVHASPSEITLTFDHPMTLQSVIFANSVGQRLPIRASLPTEPVTSLRFPVVIALQPGAYTVAWRTADGLRRIDGAFGFKVLKMDGNAPESTQMSHHHH